jgi:general secretion pathway protein B
MSYILEALKKADQERTAGNVPDLETVHWHEPGTRKSYRWLWILAALFILNGAAVTLLAIRWHAGSGEDAVGNRVARDERGSAMPNVARVRPPAATADAGPVARSAPPKVTRTAPQPRGEGRVVMARTALPPAQAPASRESSVAPQVAVPPPMPAAAATAPSRPAIAPAQPVATARIPEWDELPLDFRSSLTMPRVDVHVYDTNPQNRFILADMQKYREGDRLPNGATLEKILPDGIQLSYQGRSFHYSK